MVSWAKISVEPIVEFCKDQFRRYLEYPSLRDIFYAFIDVLWPNTKSTYKGLSSWLVEKRLKGEVDWRIIRDGSGREYETGDWTEMSIGEWVDYRMRDLESSVDYYRMPKWANQPRHVAVLCEKEADYPVVKQILRDYRVDTGYMRGYTGWRLLFEAAEAFKEKGRKPVVICLSDFDPSGGDEAKEEGKDLVSFVLNAMPKLGAEAEVVKVCVTQEQIESYQLPHVPTTQEEILKLRKDPRFKTWKHGLYRTETASFRVRQPEEFEKTLTGAVEAYFDKSIYDAVGKEEEDRRRRLREAMRGLEENGLLDKLREELLKRAGEEP